MGHKPQRTRSAGKALTQSATRLLEVSDDYAFFPLESIRSSYKFSGLNTDGSFTMAVSNSFLSPLENIPCCRSGITSGVFLIHIEKWYIVYTH